MPPNRRASAAWRARAADAIRGPGSARARPCGCASSHCASASALAQWRSMRSASVLTPRSARKLSNGPAMAPTAFCRKPSRSRHVGLALLVADDRDAADHVGVAVEVLGRRVHDDVEAELERALHPGAREGVVGHGDEAARRARSAAIAREVGQLEQRIGRRLDPDHAACRAAARRARASGRSCRRS